MHPARGVVVIALAVGTAALASCGAGTSTAPAITDPGAVRYQGVQLPAPPGSTWANAVAISPSARYVGIAASTGLFLWDGAELHAVDAPFGTIAAVNDAGVVVGDFMVDVRTTHAFRWQAGRSVDLGTLGDPAVSSAVAIDAVGTIAGWASGPGGIHAVAWGPDGSIRDLAPGTSYSNAYGIAPDGTIVGANYVADASYRHALRFPAAGGVEDLGGDHATAYAVSATGSVVGSAAFAGAEHAAVFGGGTVMDVGTLPGQPQSRLVAVNAAGTAVGYAFGSASRERPIVWSGGRLLDLGSLVDDASWSVAEARGIADDGTIAVSVVGARAPVVLRPAR